MTDSTEKIFLQALQGKITDRVPFWFMRQAGRYLPEYRELRSKKGGFLDMVYDPSAAAEVTVQPIRRFHMDAAILFSDILVVPHALGQDLKFVAGEGPKLEPVRDEAGLAVLDISRQDEIYSPVYETVSRTRALLDQEGYGDVALIGFAGSPWTVATYMVEGGGSKDYLSVKALAYKDPDFFSRLIDLVVESAAHYLIGQARAGAEALQLFDSWCSVLDEDQFERWVIDPTAQIVEKVRREYPDIPIIGFPKGAGLYYPDYIAKTKVNAVGIDAQMPLDWARENVQPLCPVQGNLEPACLLAGGEALERSVDKILEKLSAGPFIFNLGHGINKETPIEHVEYVSKRVKDFRRT